MRPGSLVRLKYTWALGSDRIGILIKKTADKEEVWQVLWSIKSSYKLQEHYASALVELMHDGQI